METIGILAWPAFSNKEENPYNYILYSNMRDEGHQLYEFDIKIRHMLKYCFSSCYQVFHIHWPTNVLFGNNKLKASLRLKMLFLFIYLIKLLGKKVVWTVHNLEAHESKFPGLQEQLSRFLYRNVDSFISLNKAGIDQIKQKASNLNEQNFAHIFHPHYQGYYANDVTRQEARKALGVPEDHFVFLFLGQIRAYKNVTGLVAAYKKLKATKSTLLIAGSVHKDVKEVLKKDLENSDSIIFTNAFVKDEDLQLYFSCADTVVIPYNRIFNSGSVFLNLSFSKPTIAPDFGALAELRQLLGSRWIKTYQGQISAEVLEKGMAEVRSESFDLPASSPDMQYFDPVTVAQETIALYKHTLQPKRTAIRREKREPVVLESVS